ncbi:MAG: sodium:calcium antiporter [Candidatus Liptonbacteria bacterium]|nr:sodium:calcium antiporter [Candidatus Liptonbacteria bacterium]
MFVDIFLFVISLLVLFYASGLMVRSLTWLGRYFAVSEYALALILVAGATSLPELFLGINSAFYGVPSLSLGNVVGANILNVTLVIGIAMLLAGEKLVFNRGLLKKYFYINAGMLFLPALLILDGALSRADGLIMLLSFFAYLANVARMKKTAPEVKSAIPDDFSLANFFRNIGKFVVGTVLLLFSANFLVSESARIAEQFGVPIILIGILISIGTTLPEIVFGVRSVFLGHGGMSLGNAFGSVIFNGSFILGLVATINPFAIGAPQNMAVNMALPFLFVALINIYGVMKGGFSRPLGLFLILCATAFILLSFSGAEYYNFSGAGEF